MISAADANAARRTPMRLHHGVNMPPAERMAFGRLSRRVTARRQSLAPSHNPMRAQQLGPALRSLRWCPANIPWFSPTGTRWSCAPVDAGRATSCNAISFDVGCRGV